MRKFLLFILLPLLAVAGALAFYFLYYNPSAGSQYNQPVGEVHTILIW